MTDLHIDDFCHDAARIIVHLYSVFPRRTSVYVVDISGDDEPDEVGLHSDRFMACLGTMLWLAARLDPSLLSQLKQSRGALEFLP